VSDFFDEAGAMRTAFEARFSAPRGGARERFVWDFWHVPDQYTYVRTFAQSFFPAPLFARFVERLRAWGRDHLGCPRILSPWLSYYVDGCRQELHTDVPHGPWAYVFSVTRWEERGFSGGETMLLDPDVLEYWRHYDPSRSTELPALVRLIEPRFNQLTVFDPRIPHGVRAVEGTRDPVRSRVVLHGWFESPTLALAPALEAAGGMPVARAALTALATALPGPDTVIGLLSARVLVGGDGAVRDVVVLSDTLVPRTGDPLAAEAARRLVLDRLRDLRFPATGETAWAIVPIQLPVARDS
jgi:hypothetical protein